MGLTDDEEDEESTPVIRFELFIESCINNVYTLQWTSFMFRKILVLPILNFQEKYWIFYLFMCQIFSIQTYCQTLEPNQLRNNLQAFNFFTMFII